MKGRKRHIVVDTLGLPLAVAVHPADIQDRDGARLVLARLLGRFPRLQLIWADGAYGGKLVEWARTVGVSRASTIRTTAAEECCTTWVMPDGHGLAGEVGVPPGQWDRRWRGANRRRTGPDPAWRHSAGCP